MKLKITGVASLAILAETEHEREWLRAVTDKYQRKEAIVEYLYPNHEPKSLNNPCLTIRWDKNE